jgi:NADH-quinone oxidoreductase subunit L
MRKMGGLKDKIPITFRTMWIAALAIAGIPGLAGFFSKDEIIWQTHASPLGSHFLTVIGLATAAMTAFYMWRLMYLTFYGEKRMDEETRHHLHESPLSMTGPLMVLAAGSVLAGWLGTPKLWHLPEWFRGFEGWLAPVFEPVGALAQESAEHASPALEWGMMAFSVLLAVGGILVARYMYLRLRPEQRPSGRVLYPVLLNKWYVDEIYEAIFVNGLTLGGGNVMARFDRGVVDGGVNGTAWATRWIARISMWWDTWIVDGVVNLTAYTVRALSFPVRFVQTGFLQNYALVFVLGVLAIFGYYWMR